jgi:hypothetical protein
MPDTIMAALSGEQISLSNSLATVATTCVLIRDPDGRSKTIISLHLIGGTKTIRTSVPGFLVIAAGLFLVAAAAHFSKDGGSADVPVALLGVGFVIAYLASRRASITLFVGRDKIQTASGGLREAAALVRAIKSAKGRLEEELMEAPAMAS